MALQAVERGLDLWHKLKAPILGVVDNMTAQPCTQCHHQGIIFNDTQSVSDFCQRLALPLLGHVSFGASLTDAAYSRLYAAFAHNATAKT